MAGDRFEPELSEAEIARLAGGMESGAQADPAFRDRLRSAFVAGELESSVKRRSREAVPGRKADSLEARDLERALRNSPEPAAREAYRSDLRTRFVQGFPTRMREVRPRRRSWSPVLVGTLAAAAALVLGFRLLWTSPAPTALWRVAFLEGTGPVRVGDRDLAPLHLDRAGERFAELAVLESHKNRLALTWGDHLRMDVLPQTVIEPVQVEGDQSALELRLVQGEILFETSPDYDGPPIHVTTPDSMVRITGTCLGILVFDGGTCVCVENGSVDVSYGGESHSVPHETTHLILQDGQGSKVVPFPAHGADPHVDPLREFVRYH